MNPLWTLAPVSFLLGAGILWFFRRTTDVPALRQTVHRLQAHLLEFWLFVDEPALVWKSWKGLLIANARLYRLLLAPLLILSIPMTPLFFVLDSVYGSAPLAVGNPALVTLGFDRPLERLSSIPQLQAPDGIAVESPAVRVFSQRQVSWRIRPRRPLSGKLQWTLDGHKVEKSVTAGPGLRLHARRRGRALSELIRNPSETPLPAGPVEWIEVVYPSATVKLLGLNAHWSVWFVVFSLLGALLWPG